ncbi:manganese efflux pump MntP family protein [Sandaracinobacter sp.]|jgi:putative Mn2+ efflux pump MntP|uniref:manganese efflux pump MntP n=1 Tax=Sandaracinobacter sp. TaxID=2487581 RepID=UPI0035B0126A
MTPLAILILSLSMSTDAFAAAVARGAAHRPAWPVALKWGLVFGLVEAATPLIGYGLGLLAADYVEAVDHWIAFALLGLVGGHMIRESFEAPAVDEGEEAPRRAGPLGLVLTAIGTSIDAAAVGVGLAFIGVNIWIVAASIGVSTFVLTSIGFRIGGAVGARFGKRAERLGGIALIGIGTLILADHMGWMA